MNAIRTLLRFLTAAVALCFAGCAFQMELPMTRRQLTRCEAPPGSLIRTTKGDWFQQLPTGPKGGKKVNHPDVYLTRGTVLQVTRVTNYVDTWNGNRQPMEMQVVAGPKKGADVFDLIALGTDDPPAKTGFRYRLNPYRAQLISRPPASTNDRE
jgi:hypothetical protein